MALPFLPAQHMQSRFVWCRQMGHVRLMNYVCQPFLNIQCFPMWVRVQLPISFSHDGSEPFTLSLIPDLLYSICARFVCLSGFYLFVCLLLFSCLFGVFLVVFKRQFNQGSIMIYYYFTNKYEKTHETMHFISEATTLTLFVSILV